MRLIDDSSECNFLDNRCRWLITEGRIELIDGARTKRKIARVEMKARVTRWSNQLNKLSDEIADWSLTSRNPTVALPTGGHSFGRQ
jgi:hypothetical protein